MKPSHGIALLIWLVLILGCSNSQRSSQLESSRSEPQLELLAFRGERSSDSFITIHGQVKNITNEKMDGVWAVVEFYDSRGVMITSSDAVIDYNPLLPGQASPFTVMQTYNPEIANFKVNFKYTFAGTIPFKDSTTPATKPSPKPRRK